MASFEKRKSGWTVRFMLYANGEAKRIRLSCYPSKKEAEKAYLDYLENPKEQSSPKAITFVDLAEEYLSSKKNDVRGSSFYDISKLINNRILPFFKKYKVSKITAKDIQTFQNSLSNYSYKYKKNIRMYLDSILAYAEKMYGIPSQTDKVKKPKDVKLASNSKHIQVWTKEQFENFIQTIEDKTFNLFFKMLFYTGMRKGECLALHWSDFDAVNKTIKISKSITRKGDAAWQENPPKNASSIRQISIPDTIALELANMNPNNNNDGYIFARNADGTAPLAERSLDRQFLSGIEKSGNPKIKIHDLRHSHASLLLSKGISILAISQRLGHSSTKETLDTYSHLMKSDEDRLIGAINDL